MNWMEKMTDDDANVSTKSEARNFAISQQNENQFDIK